MSTIFDAGGDVLWPRFPYPGLRPFRITAEADESLIFRGRNRQQDDILERLNVSQFVSVVGPSGCGKSSLVKVGVVPALRAGLLTRVGYEWLAIETRPGRDPVGNLASALAELTRPADVPPELSREEILETLNSRRAGLWLVVERLADRLQGARADRPKCVVLVLDQFEEIFERRSDPAWIKGVDRYVTLVTHLFQNPHPQLFVVLTMRTDFIGECANYPGMAELLNQTQYITPVLRDADLMDAINGPAETYGGRVESALAKAIAEDMGSGAAYNADHLPLMQHALLWLWRRSCDGAGIAEPPNPAVERPEGAPEIRLTLAMYEEQGRLRGILNNHADELLASLGGGRRADIAETMFKRLTQRDASGRYKRAPEQVETVCDVVPCTKDELSEVIEPFAGKDTSFVERRFGAEPDNPLLDLSHESLIRQWDKLRAWTDEEADKVARFRKFAGDAGIWARANRAPNLLVAGGHLTVLEEWWAANRPTKAWSDRYPVSDADKAPLSDSYDLVAAYRDASFRRRQNELNQEWWYRLARAAGAVCLALVLVGAQGLAVYRSQTDSVRAQADAYIDDNEPERALQLVVKEHELNRLDRWLRLVFNVNKFEEVPFEAKAKEALERLHEARLLSVKPGPAVNALGFSRDGRWLLASSFDRISAWDLRKPDSQPQTLRELKRADRVAWDGERNIFLRMPQSGAPELDRLVFSPAPAIDRETIHSFKDYEQRQSRRSAAFSGDGARLVIGGTQEPLTLWDLQTYKQLAHSSPVDASAPGINASGPAINADGSLIAIPGDKPNSVSVYRMNGDVLEGTLLAIERPSDCNTRASAFAFDPGDRRRLLIADGCRIYEYDAETGKKLQCFEAPGVSRLAVGRNGKIAFAEIGKGKVQIYGSREAAADGTPCRSGPVTLGRHDGTVFDLRFSPDEAEIVSSGIDGTIRVWRVDPASRAGDPQGGEVFWSRAKERLPDGGKPLDRLDVCLLREDAQSCVVAAQKP